MYKSLFVSVRQRVTSTLLVSTLALSGVIAVAGNAKADQRFAPVDLRTPLNAQLAALPPKERQALDKLVEAAHLMDALFLRQVWVGNEPMLLRLVESHSPLVEDFLLYKGPWSRLDKDKPFVTGAPSKPPQANFYPLDATKAEVEAWMSRLPTVEQTAARGFFTTIRRGADKKLVAVPYRLEYAAELGEASRLLSEAAALTSDAKLKDFLVKRAAALLSDDYYASDVAWMAIDGVIEPTLGPYEVYEDEWFNAKAAYEAFIGLRDEAETQKLARFSSSLQELESHLPMAPALRNPKIGATAPIRVVNQVFAGGDARHGVTTAAYNLPNDERVTREKGTKRVMLKNVQEAKFAKVLLPIAAVVLDKAGQSQIGFDAFFTHILMHELLHGLGPHSVAGVTVRAKLEGAYSAIEEAKADISGLWAMQYLVDKGVIDKKIGATMYTTYLASTFRSIRFGTNEAHGKGTAMQLNYFLDHGAVKVSADGTFAVVPGKIAAVVAELAGVLLTVEGHGDKKEADRLLATLGVVRPEVQRALDRLKAVPVDIAPTY